VRAAVEDGRRAGGAADYDISRPLLDGREHGSMLVCPGCKDRLGKLALELDG
jgi:hypothetical protein